MRNVRLLALAAPILLLTSACGGGDDLPPPEITSVSATPLMVVPGGTVSMTVATQDFSLVDEEHGGDHQHDGDSVNEGHFHIYLDDLMTNPLLMPATETFDVVIPAETALGSHELIVRLQDASHMIIEPQVTKSVTIDVVTTAN